MATKTKLPKWNTTSNYEKICKLTGRTPLTIKDFPEEKFGDESEYELARHKLSIIAKWINAGDKKDWNNSNQYKWYVWFRFNTGSSSFGFDYSSCYWSHSFAGVGSRLSFSTSEKADFFGKNNLDLHNIVLKHE